METPALNKPDADFDPEPPEKNPWHGKGERGLGGGMLIVGWLLALGVLTMLFARCEEQKNNPNSDPQSRIYRDAEGSENREVTLKRNRYGHYLAKGFINSKPVTFLLDTGATMVVLPSRLARHAGLQRGLSGYAQTANGQIKVYRSLIDELRIGSIVLRNVHANINPHMDGKKVLLGMSALKQIELTQRGTLLTLRQF